MKKELEEIKQYLESTLEELSDTYENHGIHMDNETQLLEKALNNVNKLLTTESEYKLAS